MSESTTLSNRTEGVHLRGLRVEVVRGPDTGRIARAYQKTLTVGTGENNDLVLTDPTVSRYHLELERALDRIAVADHDSTNGTSFGPVMIRRGTIAPGTQLVLGGTTIRVDDSDDIVVELHEEDRLGGLVGRTTELRELMATIRRVGKSNSSILILGESGTGKDLIAHAIHASSARARGPFETVDCGAMIPNLVGSELFGHERGAFTGADQQHIGALERAHTGTLFLDEVGELAPAMQAALLGALERRSFRRIGGQKPIAVDVRLVSATNRDLRAEVNSGAFRLDLYYRICVVLMRVPPLRDHAGDIPLLIEHFLRELGSSESADDVFGGELLLALKTHRWPGNVRELRNLVEAAIALGRPPDVELERIDAGEASGDRDELATMSYADARAHVLSRFEARYVRSLLQRNQGNASKAARDAKMNRSYLINLLKRHGVR